MFLNIAAYKFVELDALSERREAFRQACAEQGLKGTVMLTPEGINCFLAGEPARLRDWIAWLRAFPEFADIEVKESVSDRQPFQRMLVKRKKEIIAFGVDGVNPSRSTSPKLPPQELKRWLDEGKPVTLLDVRNDYEIKLGTFAGAKGIGVDHFRDFPAAVDQLPEPLKEEPLVMFCTGGIRCEKAGPLMESRGFKQVYQLDGGILRYFEECGGAYYDGDCFVFDGRVAVDPNLRPTDAAQCFACQAILTADEQQDERYVLGESCPFCFATPEERLARCLEKRHARLRALVDPLPGSVPYTNRRPINIPQRCDGETLIDSLVVMHPHVGRDQWLEWIAQHRILQGMFPVRPEKRVRGGEQYFHVIPDTVEPAVDVGIEVLFEDESIVAVNKPAPLPMHPCGRFNRNTLISILNQVYAPEVLRPAHRLDANTTGIVVLSRSQKFARILQSAFATTAVTKRYLVRCQGHPAEAAFGCEASISRDATQAGGRTVSADGLPAKTEFTTLETFSDGTALLEAQPITGRTNQIRVHLWHLGLPVVGDPVYLPNRELGDRQTRDLDAAMMCLHAWRLCFPSPLDNRTVDLETPRPMWAERPSITND